MYLKYTMYMIKNSDLFCFSLIQLSPLSINLTSLNSSFYLSLSSTCLSLSLVQLSFSHSISSISLPPLSLCLIVSSLYLSISLSLTSFLLLILSYLPSHLDIPFSPFHHNYTTKLPSPLYSHHTDIVSCQGVGHHMVPYPREVEQSHH